MNGEEYKMAERLKDELEQLHRFAAACNPIVYNPRQTFIENEGRVPTASELAQKIAQYRWLEAAAMMKARRELYPYIYGEENERTVQVETPPETEASPSR